MSADTGYSGLDRRAEIRSAMLRAAAARRRVRAVRNGTLLCGPIVAAGVLLFLSARSGGPSPSSQNPLAEARARDSKPAAEPVAQEGREAYAEGIIERRISDDELAGLLRESGAQMGLVRVGHQVRLIPWESPQPERPDAESRPTTDDAAS